jgi:CDP-diacylglycerol--glycerol-3-phosphate 3-phosphatidyltransferase
MTGLYVLKPWFSRRLARTGDLLIRHRVPPHAITFWGVLAAAGAAACLAALPAPVAAGPVLVLLVARLACANLDGAVARRSGSPSAWGAILNELGDRAADLLVVAALATHVPLGLGLAAIAATSVPSWVSLAGAAAGLPRINGGPVGKTERCLAAVIAAATGWYAIALALVAVGSLLTAVLRLRQLASLRAAWLIPARAGG